jgi:hypothetical protein
VTRVIMGLTAPEVNTKAEAKPAIQQYHSCLVASSGGVGFDDTSLSGLLAQTQEWIDDYPVGRGDYTAGDREANIRVVWAIMADKPSDISADGTRYFIVGHPLSSTMH